MTDANYIRRQLFLDFEHFARRMRLKDTMDFVNFIGKTKVSQDTILVSMDATSLYTNIPQKEGIATVCKEYEAFHSDKPLACVISQSKTKPIEWKRFIDDIFSLWDSDKKEINLFIEQANNFHPTIKFTAEISENETSYYYHSSTCVLPVVPREQCR